MKNLTQAYNKDQFLTNDDAMHIKTDYVIGDINDYQERKNKYYGNQSKIKLLVKEENEKLK